MAFKGWTQKQILTARGHEKAKAPLILSASRATDIPAFYGHWLVAQFKRGYLWRKQPYTGKFYPISLSEVAFIVFWTKDPGPFLKYLPFFDKVGIGYYFLFTLNDYEQEHFEPNLPPLVQRIDTFRKLADSIGTERVLWRFDPLIKTTMGVSVSQRVEAIAQRIQGYTDTLIFSFLQLQEYKKVQRNFANRFGMTETEQQKLIHTPQEQVEVVNELKQITAKYTMQLASCADPAYIDAWAVQPGACIDGERIGHLAPENLKLQRFLETGDVGGMNGLLFTHAPEKKANLKDRNQRKLCRCIYSQDIGRYNTCKHGCVYCYACRYSK